MSTEHGEPEHDAEDRAIARALGADPGDTAAVDEHRVDEYREVLARLPLDEATPRPELEDRVVGAALARRAAAAPALDASRARARARHRVRLVALAATAVAAAVVVGLLVQGGSSGPPAPGGRVSLATATRADIDALTKAPGARRAVFADGMGKVVIDRSGNGAVYDLPSDGAVTIGLISDRATTTLGPVEPTQRTVSFVVDHPERVTAVTVARNGAPAASVKLLPG